MRLVLWHLKEAIKAKIAHLRRQLRHAREQKQGHGKVVIIPVS